MGSAAMTDVREAIARAVGQGFRHGGIDVQGDDTWTEIPWDEKSEESKAVDLWVADAALAAIEAAGWQCVPKEPTLDQIGAARDQADCLGDIYRAMLAAALNRGGRDDERGNAREDTGNL